MPHMFVTSPFQLGCTSLVRCLLYFFGIESQRRCFMILWLVDYVVTVGKIDGGGGKSRRLTSVVKQVAQRNTQNKLKYIG